MTLKEVLIKIKQIFFKKTTKYRITEVVQIFVEYDNFLDMEHTNKDNMINEFKNKLQNILHELTKEFNIFNIKNKSKVNVDLIVDDNFLFYNNELAMDYQEFIITKDEKIEYLDFDKWLKEVCENKKDDIMFCNDHDGQGISFYINKNTPRYEFLVKILFDNFFKNKIYYNEYHVFRKIKN